jgi:1-acyl-sn-glycerol-3-phosphate acyltransferase
MIKSNPKVGVKWFFALFLRIYSRIFFNRIIWPDLPPPSSKSVLLLCNHQSWWDAILIFLWYHKNHFSTLHVMMLFSELKKRKFLTFLGAFSVQKRTKSIAHSIGYSLDLLERKQHVLIFPQGRIESPYVEKLTLSRGVCFLLENMPKESELWVFSIHYSMSSAIRPHCTIYLQQLSTREPKEVEIQWNQFQKQSQEKQKEQWS